MTDERDFEPNPRAVVGANAPPKPRAKFKRTCPETGVEFITETHDRMFSTDAAKAAFHNRSNKIGRRLVPLAMAWREGRNAKGNSARARALRASASRAFSEMCAILDAAVTDDREAGRMSKLRYVRRVNAAGGSLTREEREDYQQTKIDREAAQAEAAKKAAKAAPQPKELTK